MQPDEAVQAVESAPEQGLRLEILATRQELADMIGIEPRTVTEIMSELEAVGAVYRQRRGRVVRYFVNPILGTHLSGAARDKAQAAAPELRLVELA